MRYRRLSYRYTMVVRSGPTWPPGDVWHGERLKVVFGEPRWRPDADMYETEAAIEVTVDLAGVEEDDIEVQLFEDTLVVEGRRQLPDCEEGAVYHAAGIRWGPFHLELPLPASVDAERVQARCERGSLRVTLPKSEASG